LTALKSTIDNVGRCSKLACDPIFEVGVIGLEEASHDIVHRRLWVLGSHIEPETCGHGKRPVLVNQVWVFEKIELAVVRARGGENI